MRVNSELVRQSVKRRDQTQSFFFTGSYCILICVAANYAVSNLVLIIYVYLCRVRVGAGSSG